MKFTMIVLMAVMGLVAAQNPHLNRNTGHFMQNQGNKMVTGVGFQTNLLTSGAIGAANTQFQFVALASGYQPRCVDSTLEVNFFGRSMTCHMQYVPDSAIAAGGENFRMQVVNMNGMSLVETVGRFADHPDFIHRATHTFPPTPTGLSLSGGGFPSPGTIPAGDTFVLTVRDDSGNTRTANVHDPAACSYTRTSINCVLTGGAVFVVGDTVSASLLYTAAGGFITNWAGATQGIVGPAQLQPTITNGANAGVIAINQNQRLVTLTGSNFASGSGTAANIISIAGGAQALTARAIEVNPAGTQMIFELSPYITDGNVGGNFGSITVTTNGVASAATAANYISPINAVPNRIRASNIGIPRDRISMFRIRGEGFPWKLNDPLITVTVVLTAFTSGTSVTLTTTRTNDGEVLAITNDYVEVRLTNAPFAGEAFGDLVTAQVRVQLVGSAAVDVFPPAVLVSIGRLISGGGGGC